MASTIGPLFAVWADAPAQWSKSLGGNAHDVVLRSSAMGQAWVVQVVSKSLLNKLQTEQSAWVYLAQIIKEDGESIYAFENPHERALFCEFREIDSIGSKYAALAVAELGFAGVSLMLRSSALPPMKVAGLGPKTLEKIKAGVKERAEVFAKILQNTSVVGAALGGTVGTALGGTVGPTSGGTAGTTLDGAVGIAKAAPTYAATQALPHSQIPDLIFQALTKLGLKTVDVFSLYEECLKAQSNFSELTTGEQVKGLLARWNQRKNAQKHGNTLSSRNERNENA